MRKFLFGGLAATLLLSASQVRAEDSQACVLMPTSIITGPDGRVQDKPLETVRDDVLAEAQQKCQPDDLLVILAITDTHRQMLSAYAEYLCRFDRTISRLDASNLLCVYRGKPRTVRQSTQG